MSKNENPTIKELLNKAHELGLEIINTELLQAPDENNLRAVVRITVRIAGRVVNALGEATEENVSKAVSTNLVGMAETRALARAIRFGANIPETSKVELPSSEFANLRAADARKDYIVKLASKRDVPKDLKEEMNAAWRELTNGQADDFIERLKG